MLCCSVTPLSATGLCPCSRLVLQPRKGQFLLFTPACMPWSWQYFYPFCIHFPNCQMPVCREPEPFLACLSGTHCEPCIVYSAPGCPAPTCNLSPPHPVLSLILSMIIPSCWFNFRILKFNSTLGIKICQYLKVLYWFCVIYLCIFELNLNIFMGISTWYLYLVEILNTFSLS